MPSMASMPPPGLDTDGPPPLPPGATQRPSLRQLAGSSQELGQEAANPQIQALEGLQQAEQGIQKLSQGLPELAPALAQLVQQLRQVVPEAMSKASGGGAQVAPPPPQGAMPM